MPTTKNINNLIINKVESKEIFNNMVNNNQTNEDEIYLVNEPIQTSDIGNGAVTKDKLSQSVQNEIYGTPNTVTAGGADLAEIGVWQDNNSDNEDRLYRFVTIVGNNREIDIADSTSQIVGTSNLKANVGFIGNYTDGDENNNSKVVVSIVGVVPVKKADGETIIAGDRVMSDDNGYAVKSTNNLGYRVLGVLEDDLLSIVVSPNTDMIQRIKTDMGDKQDTLVSGTNIKTINNKSILGSGNITIEGGSGTNVFTTEIIFNEDGSYSSSKTFAEIKTAYENGNIIKATITSDGSVTEIPLLYYSADEVIFGSMLDSMSVVITIDNSNVVTINMSNQLSIFTTEITTNDDDTYSSSKTFEEINEAYENGNIIKAVIDDTVELSLVYYSSEGIVFSASMGASYYTLVINNDNTIEADMGDLSSGGSDGKEDVSNKKQEITESTTDYPSTNAVKTFVEGKGYLTSHQDISGKEDTSNKKNEIDTSTTYYPTNNAVKTFVEGKGYLTSHQDITGKENTSNKVTSITSTSTDTQYPSAKAVWTQVDNITAIANGRCKSFVYNTETDFINAIGTVTADNKLTYNSIEYTLNIGDIFLIVDTGVPDYWWTGTADTNGKKYAKLEISKVELDTKQDALTDTQLNAVNSGITSTQVANIHTHSNKTVLDGISSTDITNWNGKTSNTGTITGITMNGASKGTSGVVDLGTVVTDVSNLQTKISSTNKIPYSNISDTPTIPTTLPANGGNADTIDGYHIRIGTSGAEGYITFVV